MSALKGIAILAAFVLLLNVAFTAEFARKRLSGPPEEFENHGIPNPENVKMIERSITQNIYLKKDGIDYVASATIPVDGPGEFLFSFASPFASYITLKMKDPRGKHVDLQKDEIKSPFPIGVGVSVPVQSYFILNSDRGYYTLDITAKNLPEKEIKKIEDSKLPHGVITLVNNDNLVIESHLNSYIIAVGKSVGVHAKIVNTDSRNDIPGMAVSVSSASMNVISPNGKDTVVPMNDNGVGADVTPNDGIYSGQLTITSSGLYVMQPVLSGFYDTAGAETATEFVRSTQHLVSVSEVSLELTGKATMVKKDSERMLINIGVTETKGHDGLRAYAEVWGKKGDQIVPVAWMGGLTSIENGMVSLELNVAWLQRAGVSGSLVLRNTYISDVTTSFPIASFPADIPVDNSATIPVVNFDKLLLKAPLPITYEMRNGVNPLTFNKTAAANKKGLVLIPGYCAEVNPWARNKDDFSDAYFFDEMKINVPNDEYARKVIAFAEKKGLTSFGLVGHSQGGVVATHIHNYYFTGLESSTGGRPIQSVGTPYHGSTAAANAADLGKIFGIGCGSNTDLSRDGAANWLSGISADTKKDVYFFTTTYKRNTFFGDYCSAPMNSILQWPNDGVTELKYATLEGANDMGNKDKWCHTLDMSYPAQYDDHDRNKAMNTAAAR